MALPLASFTVNDGASTPVAQTFTVAKRDGTVSQFRNMASGLVRGNQTLTHEIRLGATSAAANRALISLTTPVEGVVDGQNTVVRSSLFKVEANFAPDASETERATAWGLLLNTLSNADVKSSVTKLQTLA
jgi:hypothetical protein